MTNYKKRDGTSGICGHLYETKLISLINYRAIHDDDVKEFYLATNMDGVGAFDDICIRAKVKVKESDRHVAVFIQAKHSKKDHVLPTLNSKKDLGKYFESYLNIRRAFKPDNENVFFKGNFEEIDCLFVMYTIARNQPNVKLFKGDFASKLNDLIGTGGQDTGVQLCYNKDDANVAFFYKILMKHQFTALAQLVAKFLCKKADSILLVEGDLVLQYHFILAQKVFDVSDIQRTNEGKKHRVASFRQDFFETDEEYIMLFKNTLFIEILKERKLKETETHNLLSKFLKDSSEITILSKLMGNVLKYENDKLKFVNEMPEDLKKMLTKVRVLKSTVDEAIELAAKEILKSRTFKVSATFGNRDLTIRGDTEKIERRLDYLTSEISKLLIKSNPENKVTLDNSLKDGLLKSNGGLAGIVGNLIVFDKNTKMLKFTDNCEILGDNAKRLLEKLKSKMSNLDEYRFDVKVKKFPKLSLDITEHDENLVKEFFSKFIFYTNQAEESVVENILKDEIQINESDIQNSEVTSDAIFLQYHDGIQKWWMNPKKCSYLKKDNTIYENAKEKLLNKSVIKYINLVSTAINPHSDYKFENVKLKLNDEVLINIIVTDSSVLTTAKVTQYLNLEKNHHIVLDLKYILDLKAGDFSNFCKALEKKKGNDKIIFVCKFNELIKNKHFTRLKNITNAINKKQTIIITTQKTLKKIEEYFSPAHRLSDEMSNLIDMTKKSQKYILQKTNVIFQGEKISLDLVVDDCNINIIDGKVLNKIINNEDIIIGKPYPYVGEKLEQETLDTTSINHTYDLKNPVILIPKAPEMSKLLVHLSLKTKELDQKIWMVKINLLDYARQLNEWQKGSTSDISTLESLEFMLREVALGDKSGLANNEPITLGETPNNGVYLQECSDAELNRFELNLFLQFYNTQKLIFIFECLDEISPLYAREALTLIRSVKNYPRQHKIWICV